jgi:mannose-1-phosphate guanylyltransferase/mannose-1-phosphate guanylyltransferase/phosphomannomutase
MHRAFVLGAGLGTRLRPLTLQLPKPLIPLHQRPLMEYAFAQLHAAGIREFVINTHYLPEAYTAAFPDHVWRGCPLSFVQEPVLMETGGGLANVRGHFAGGGPFFVFNGDVFTDLPLAPLMEAHEQQGNLVTLLLRSTGPVCNVAMDSASGRLLDFRNRRATNHPDLFQFTGIYIVAPAFFRYLPEPGIIEGMVEAWLRALEAGERLGGIVADGGVWLDLGDRDSYLAAHQLIPQPDGWVHPSADVARDADVRGSSIAAGCRIGTGAAVLDSVLWPGASVAPGARLERCVVMAGHTAAGTLHHADI